MTHLLGPVRYLPRRRTFRARCLRCGESLMAGDLQVFCRLEEWTKNAAMMGADFTCKEVNDGNG